MSVLLVLCSKREVQESLVKEWLEEDVVWPNSKGHIPAPSGNDWRRSPAQYVHPLKSVSLFVPKRVLDKRGLFIMDKVKLR